MSAKPWLTREYRQYLLTGEWQLVRMAALARAEYHCSRCSISSGLEVHHLNYQRLGSELPTDVIVLCEEHHLAEHRQLTWNRRLNGWATKRWGEDWGEFVDEESAEDQFNSWLDRRSGRREDSWGVS